MDLLLENINGTEGSFYERLSEEGYFDQSLFAELILFVDNLNGMELNKNDRLKKSTELWHLSYRIQSSFGYNYNESDGFEIDNMEEEKLIEIGQVLEYICKSFTDNKQLDMDFINEMT
ncbi:hypothetical protein [uncultured Winogradskyella sp.]|uniref:hypothetical protein n=1 Tax=uncultured Winogradskyella sp. TaxID=395353 RepID=UPI002616CED8|nr:hypothetical protein [uncultured Winogradskyella sp.]